jgi:hypothetical protein
MTISMFLVPAVLILGWLLASLLGSWAFFAGEQSTPTD